MEFKEIYDIKSILNNNDILDIISKHLKVRKIGSNFVCLCPFHKEKTPSFTINKNKQFYYCFGCHEYGNIINFLMKYNGYTFRETLIRLSKNNIYVENTKKNYKITIQNLKIENYKIYNEYLKKAKNLYRNLLIKNNDATFYLKERGIDVNTANFFELGWSGNFKKNLFSIFKDNKEEMLKKFGLVIKNESGFNYNLFYERIMFPIYNMYGYLIGFGGRSMFNNCPKYINSPKTYIFSKSNELYGLWYCIKNIKKLGYVIVVEGYMDVITLLRYGFYNVVSTMGTSVTKYQIKKLMKIVNKIIFVFDGDNSGRKASFKTSILLLPILKDKFKINITCLPSNHDPDSYLKNFGKRQFKLILYKSYSISKFVIYEIKQIYNLKKKNEKFKFLNKLNYLLIKIPECNLKKRIKLNLLFQIKKNKYN